jgi:hypothetical protein
VTHHGGEAHAVEHLPSKYKALSSDPSKAKTNKQTKQARRRRQTLHVHFQMQNVDQKEREGWEYGSSGRALA